MIPSDPTACGDLMITSEKPEVETSSERAVRVELEIDTFDDYYNEVVVFKVENTLFRAFKKAFLYPGSFFQALFALPEPDPASTSEETCGWKARHGEGTSPENPILLERISKDDFRSFLKVLIPFAGVPRCSGYEEWKGALYLATMWEFPMVRQKAIIKMPPLLKSRSIAERILVSWKYEVKSWLIDALTEAASGESVSRRNLKKAGIDGDTISGILAVRDKAVKQQIGRLLSSVDYCRKGGGHVFIRARSYGDPYMSVDDWKTRGPLSEFEPGLVRSIVLEEFSEELKAMRDD